MINEQENHVAWETANGYFNNLKGDYVKSIVEGAQLVPTEVCTALSIVSTDRLLQVMCNDGREIAYLSYWFKAKAVGVDFSLAAIEFARHLNMSLGLQNEFVHEEIYQFLDRSPYLCFDKALATLGTLKWLSDLDTFFSLICKWMIPGGTLVVWDFHPLISALDNNQSIVRNYPTMSTGMRRSEGLKDYVSNPECYSLASRRPSSSEAPLSTQPIVVFEHTLSDIVAAIGKQPCLRITALQEMPFSWEERCFSWLNEVAPFRFEAAAEFYQLPVTFLLSIARS